MTSTRAAAVRDRAQRVAVAVLGDAVPVLLRDRALARVRVNHEVVATPGIESSAHRFQSTQLSPTSAGGGEGCATV